MAVTDDQLDHEETSINSLYRKFRSKHVQEFENQSFDYVLTVCHSAKESCPVFPGHSNRIHKGFEDPAALQGTEEERLSLFRRVRDEIRDT
jgi:arsenate reductase